MSANFIPHRGDVVWIDMQPQAGHEQSGRRPAIVLSPKSYNGNISPMSNADLPILQV